MPILLSKGSTTSLSLTPQEVIISAADDSIQIGDGSGNFAGVTPAGELKVSLNSSTLPTGASTSALQTAGNVNLASIDSKLTSSLYVIGQANQTAIVNNILTTTSGSVATDVLEYRTAAIQIISSATSGTFIFEGSNDNINFQTLPVYNQFIIPVTNITSAINASVGNVIYILAIPTRYIRVRIVTTISGGVIQAFSKFSLESFSSTVTSVVNNTAANLLTSSVISSGTITTVSSVTSSNSSAPILAADVASSALTTTTTTATINPTFGSAYIVNVPVTAVSGTNPTLDIQIQESDDSGTNWKAVYDFPRITTTGAYRTPPMLYTGNRIRYVQTVSGTTPSFTRAINRDQMSLSVSLYRQLIDRTIVLTTLSSVSQSIEVAGSKNAQILLNIGAASVAPVIQLQGSDDQGLSWYSIGTTLPGIANSTVSLTISDVTSQLFRAIVTTAGTAVTPGYVLIKAF